MGRDVTILVPENTEILLVDDDDGNNYEENFRQILNKKKIRYLVLSESNTLKLSNQFDLNVYKLIIWNDESQDGKQLARGIYFMRLMSEDQMRIRKMILLS
ncbi:MAG: hypothetical protein J7L94_16645 [Caldisericaceae bacterium]|nr:hypothetical protein [Caldisericaceae bacterium]